MTRSRRALDALVSGLIVYGLMAACSGKTTMQVAASGVGGAGHGGSGGHAGSGGDGSLFDALRDPVSDALAGIENPQSGTRLKGKFTMGADGSKQYQPRLPRRPSSREPPASIRSRAWWIGRGWKIAETWPCAPVHRSSRAA